MRITQDAGGIRFAVKVVPGASRDRVVGELGDALKVAVSEPPQGGAANAAVVGVLANAVSACRARRCRSCADTLPRKEIHVTGISEAHAARIGLLSPRERAQGPQHSKIPGRI